jgi:hypothetical protein
MKSLKVALFCLLLTAHLSGLAQQAGDGRLPPGVLPAPPAYGSAPDGPLLAPTESQLQAFTAKRGAPGFRYPTGLPQGYKWCVFDRAFNNGMAGSFCPTKAQAGLCGCDEADGWASSAGNQNRGVVVEPPPPLSHPPSEGEDYPAYARRSGEAPRGYRWCEIDRATRGPADPQYCLTDSRFGDCLCKHVDGWSDVNVAGKRGKVFVSAPVPYGTVPIVFPTEADRPLCVETKWNWHQYAAGYYGEVHVEGYVFECWTGQPAVAKEINVTWRTGGNQVKTKHCVNTQTCIFDDRGMGVETVSCSAANAKVYESHISYKESNCAVGGASAPGRISTGHLSQCYTLNAYEGPATLPVYAGTFCDQNESIAKSKCWASANERNVKSAAPGERYGCVSQH